MSDMLLQPGQLTSDGAFRLERHLGGGGFGQVWLAVDRFTGDARAVKFCLDLGAASTLRMEIDSILELYEKLSKREGIVQFYRPNLDAQPPYIVLEYCSGGDLLALMNREGPLPPARVAELMLPPVRALASAHDMGVVHRDIKPANILIGGDGHTRITDFGLARIVVEQEMNSIMRSMAVGASALAGGPGLAGTAHYMAPELRRGDVQPNDLNALKRCDVYALGVTMAQLLLGDPRLDGAAMDDEDIEAAAKPLPALGTLVTDCLKGRAERRPPDAGSVARRIEMLGSAFARPLAASAALAHASATAAAPPTSTPTSAPPPSPRRFVATVMIDPPSPRAGEVITVHYRAQGRLLEGARRVDMHWSTNNWQESARNVAMQRSEADCWWATLVLPPDTHEFNVCFTDGLVWDTHDGRNWNIAVANGSAAATGGASHAPRQVQPASQPQAAPVTPFQVQAPNAVAPLLRPDPHAQGLRSALIANPYNSELRNNYLIARSQYELLQDDEAAHNQARSITMGRAFIWMFVGGFLGMSGGVPGIIGTGFFFFVFAWLYYPVPYFLYPRRWREFGPLPDDVVKLPYRKIRRKLFPRQRGLFGLW